MIGADRWRSTPLGAGLRLGPIPVREDGLRYEGRPEILISDGRTPVGGAGVRDAVAIHLRFSCCSVVP